MSSDVPGSNIRERYKEALYFAQFGRRAGGVNEDPVLGRQIRLHPKLASPYEKAKLELAMLVAPAEIRDGTSGFEKMMMPTTGSAGRSNQPGMPQMPFNMGAGGDRGDEGGKNLAGFFGEKAPTVEELWLAQEDYWVKHELLKIIRSTIDKLAALQESPLKPEEQKPGFLAQRRFTNDTWKIDLRFQRPTGAISSATRAPSATWTSTSASCTWPIPTPTAASSSCSVRATKSTSSRSRASRWPGAWRRNSATPSRSTSWIRPSRSRWKKSLTGPRVQSGGSTRSSWPATRTAPPT